MGRKFQNQRLTASGKIFDREAQISTFLSFFFFFFRNFVNFFLDFDCDSSPHATYHRLPFLFSLISSIMGNQFPKLEVLTNPTFKHWFIFPSFSFVFRPNQMHALKEKVSERFSSLFSHSTSSESSKSSAPDPHTQVLVFVFCLFGCYVYDVFGLNYMLEWLCDSLTLCVFVGIWIWD